MKFMGLPESERELQQLVERFEGSALTKDEWHHAEHVAVAVWYLAHQSEDNAISKVRRGIQSLNSILGIEQTLTSGYHETWTVFFMKKLNQFLVNEVDPDLPLIERMNSAIEYLKDFRSVSREHYSKDLILSWEARTEWREPDLKPL